MPKILADKVGGKKKLAAMLEEAKARARDEDERKRAEQSGRDGDEPCFDEDAAKACRGESDFDQ